MCLQFSRNVIKTGFLFHAEYSIERHKTVIHVDIYNQEIDLSNLNCLNLQTDTYLLTPCH